MCMGQFFILTPNMEINNLNKNDENVNAILIENTYLLL